MKSFDDWLNDLAEKVREKERKKTKPSCDTCEDTGITMEMVSYGGPPFERDIYCPDCGSGLPVRQ